MYLKIALFVILTLQGVGLLRGETSPVATETAPVLRTIEDVWAMQPKQEFACNLEMLVLYADSEWNCVWAQMGNHTTYVSFDPWPADLRSGQRVKVEGRVAQGAGFCVKNATLQELSRDLIAEPMLADKNWTEAFADKPRWVAMEGVLQQMHRNDPKHWLGVLKVHGKELRVWLRTLNGQKPSSLAIGSNVRLTGVLNPSRSAPTDEVRWEFWCSDEFVATSPDVLDPNPQLPFITRFDELWQVTGSTSVQMHRVRMELLVHFIDPDWKTIWAECEGVIGFLALGGRVPACKPGQRVLLEGLVYPEKGRTIESPHLSLRGEPEALAVQPVQDFAGKMDKYNARLVELEGFVEKQVETDASHLRLDMIVEGVKVTLWVVHDLKEAIPPMEGAVVSARGIFCLSTDLAGHPSKPEMSVPNLKSIRFLRWLDHDPCFQFPVTSAEDLAHVEATRIAHVKGRVWSQQPGRSLTIWSDNGPVTLLTEQSARVQLGETIEGVGYPVPGADGWRLNRAIYRRVTEQQPAGDATLSRLSLAEQVRMLSIEEARRSYPVRLKGVVTWSDPSVDYFFLADASGGMRIQRQPQAIPTPEVGEMVLVVGVSDVGGFAPIVRATSVHGKGTRELPEARAVTLEQALTGIEEAQWVSMIGYVRGVSREGSWLRLAMSCAAGDFSCLVPQGTSVDSLVGAVVRVRGVCGADTNERRQLTAVRLWVPGASWIEVEEARPWDVFSVPHRTVLSLRQFGTWQTANRRVRISGVVVHQSPGHWLRLQDGAESVLVLSSEASTFALGDIVEAVGFPVLESNRIVLREAVSRRLGTGTEPTPVVLDGMDRVDVERDGCLVSARGVLLNLEPWDVGMRLVIQSDSVVFEALLEMPRQSEPPDLYPGSTVELTGVYSVKYDERRQPSGASLLLRRPSDVKVVHPASWWTVEKALVMAAVLAVGALLGLFWNIVLRRRVRQQTSQIRERLESEKAARLEAALMKASKLESLGLLAGGIAHDFNNLLTIILCNLSLARINHAEDNPGLFYVMESEKATQRARHLAQQLLTFAKGGEPVRQALMIEEVVRESAEFSMHGSGARCEFDMEPGLWPANVDKGQVGQVVQNIVLNASQAMPDGGIVRISLRNAQVEAGAMAELAPGRYIELSIVDTGVGIDPEVLPRIFEPYFTTRAQGNGLGLATVYSIIKRHQGHLVVESERNHGTRFRIWLPAADSLPQEQTQEHGPFGELPRASGRILFMDDDDSIRMAATVLMQRMGFEVMSVSDGSEVATEYARARSEGSPYDMVILDLTVPGGMGGARAMEQLLQVDPNVLAIVSSGYSSDPVLANFREYGFRAIVPKPYNAEDLARALGEALASRELQSDSVV